MHAEDDHAKNYHMCVSKYSFTITRADGTSGRQAITSVDDSYGRTIKFWIDGFADTGQPVIATKLDTTYEIISATMFRTGQSRKLTLRRPF
jgi:hypothetical protein